MRENRRNSRKTDQRGSIRLTVFLLLCVILLSGVLAFQLRQIRQERQQTEQQLQGQTEPAQQDPSTAPEKQPAEPEQPTKEEQNTPETQPLPEEKKEPSAVAEDPEETPEEDPAEKEDPEQTPKEDPDIDPPATVEEQAAAILAEMSLRERICQMFIVTPEQLTGVRTVTSAGETTRQALQTYPVGGLIYMGANLVDPAQVTQMIANTQDSSALGLFIAVDEEGGRVARLGSNAAMGTTSFPAMLTVGASGHDAVYQAGLTIGTEIQQFGFNLDFAPVADVYSNPANTVIGDRAFSTDFAEAAELVASAVQGFQDSGILCTLKHFPGHGNTAEDSHAGAATSNRTLEELEQDEFQPFRSGIAAGAEMVMVGHISLPAVTGDQTPATLSHEIVTDLLREKLGFSGVVITDAMNMGAITDYYSSGDAAVAAVSAGVDLILSPSSLSGAVSGLLSAVESGTLSEARINESVLRILTMKLEHGIIPME